MCFGFNRCLIIVAFGVLQKFSLEAQYVHPFETSYHKSHNFFIVSSSSNKLFPQPHNSSEKIDPKYLFSGSELNQKASQSSSQHSDTEDSIPVESSIGSSLVELNLSKTPSPDPDHLLILPDLILNFDPDDFSDKEPYIHSTQFHFIKKLSAFAESLQWIDSKDSEDYNSLTSYITFEFEYSIEKRPSATMRYSGTKKSPNTHSTNLQTDHSTSKDTQLQGQNFKIQHLFHDYPQFLPKSSSAPTFYYDIFSSSPFEPVALIENNKVLTTEQLIDPVISIQSSRQRRANWETGTTYDWEIDDFTPGADSKLNQPTNFATVPSSGQKFNLSIIANDGIDSLAVLAYGMTGGNALNDYTGTNGFNFLTATGWGASGDVTSSFNLITSGSGGHTGIDAWLNGFDGYTQPTDLWGVHKDGNELYLTYEFSNLNFTPVPEPSTYFMTGALFCLIGCNRESRRSFKKLISFFYSRHSRKENSTEIENQVS